MVGTQRVLPIEAKVSQQLELPNPSLVIMVEVEDATLHINKPIEEALGIPLTILLLLLLAPLAGLPLQQYQFLSMLPQLLMFYPRLQTEHPSMPYYHAQEVRDEARRQVVGLLAMTSSPYVELFALSITFPGKRRRCTKPPSSKWT
ncbi:hypothetical protein ACFE04_012867 [Oxalis oulophora]